MGFGTVFGSAADFVLGFTHPLRLFQSLVFFSRFSNYYLTPCFPRRPDIRHLSVIAIGKN